MARDSPKAPLVLKMHASISDSVESSTRIAPPVVRWFERWVSSSTRRGEGEDRAASMHRERWLCLAGCVAGEDRAASMRTSCARVELPRRDRVVFEDGVVQHAELRGLRVDSPAFAAQGQGVGAYDSRHGSVPVEGRHSRYFCGTFSLFE